MRFSRSTLTTGPLSFPSPFREGTPSVETSRRRLIPGLRFFSRGSKGFTLIELLVVVAILAILAGLLMPAISGARHRAQAAQCAHQLKQLGYAVQMYWNENDERLVAYSGRPYPDWYSATQGWARLIFPYHQNLAIYRDPGCKTLPSVPIDYYLNILQPYIEGGGDPGVGSKTGGFLLDARRISSPSTFILMSEDLGDRDPNDYDPTNEVSDRTGFSHTRTTYPPPHQGGVNLLFADLHVAAFRRFETNQMTYWYEKGADWAVAIPP